MPSCLLITGGAGFIGSCYVLRMRAAGVRMVNVDKLTYSGNTDNLTALTGDAGHIFVQGDIGNDELMAHLLHTHQPDAILNFAAETHVDRSIHDPDAFVRTNVLGTCALLRASMNYWRGLKGAAKETFRFLHISTDEVFGALQPGDAPFTETTPYAPNSPYAASKAASDHLVRAFYETYGLPILITNCSNNYGPRQFPEKLIPLVICNALERKPLPVYGQGLQIRDWLHVEDHCTAVDIVLRKGAVGNTYNIGGRAERRNIDVVRTICTVLDDLRPHPAGLYSALITYVTDRLGHDFRYAMDCTRIETELGWRPGHTFEAGLAATVLWYCNNPEWTARVLNGAYREWMRNHYGGGVA